MKKFLVAALLVVGSLFVASPAKADVVFVQDAFGNVQTIEREGFSNFFAFHGFNPNVTVVRDGFGARLAFVNGVPVGFAGNRVFVEGRFAAVGVGHGVVVEERGFRGNRFFRRFR